MFSPRIINKQLLQSIYHKKFLSFSQVSDHTVLNLKLPTTKETKSFVFSNDIKSLQDLQRVIQYEDNGVQSINAISQEGIVYSRCTPISFLLQNGFTLELLDENLEKHSVKLNPVDHAVVDAESVKDQIKALAGSLEIVENKIALQENLRQKLLDLNTEFQPLEKKRLELSSRSHLRTNLVVWGGLIAMGAQFGFLARLVWWDYSWDIMEPVTYFVTYGTAIVMYCYFVCVKSDYNFETARDRWNLRSFHKIAKRQGFDIDLYNRIANQKQEIEDNLRHLENIGALLKVQGQMSLENENASS